MGGASSHFPFPTTFTPHSLLCLDTMSLRFNILFLALQAALVLAAGCNHDNCLRAVIASRAKPFPTVASQDCTSFFHKTVTPCPSTTTVTVTAGASGKALYRRDVEPLEHVQLLEARAETAQATQCPVTAAPTAVPTYASACSGKYFSHWKFVHHL